MADSASLVVPSSSRWSRSEPVTSCVFSAVRKSLSLDWRDVAAGSSAWPGGTGVGSGGGVGRGVGVGGGVGGVAGVGSTTGTASVAVGAAAGLVTAVAVCASAEAVEVGDLAVGG